MPTRSGRRSLGTRQHPPRPLSLPRHPTRAPLRNRNLRQSQNPNLYLSRNQPRSRQRIRSQNPRRPQLLPMKTPSSAVGRSPSGPARRRKKQRRYCGAEEVICRPEQWSTDAKCFRQRRAQVRGLFLKTVRFGKTGLKVSKLCLGTMTLGSRDWKPWALDEAESKPILKQALDCGFTFFDMADWYSTGENERVVASTLPGRIDNVRVAVCANERDRS